jgi:hypothetical protein
MVEILGSRLFVQVPCRRVGGKLEPHRRFLKRDLIKVNIQWSTQRKRRNLTSFSNIIFLCPEYENVFCDDESNYCLFRWQAT